MTEGSDNIPLAKTLADGWKQILKELVQEGVIPFKITEQKVDYPSDFIDALKHDVALRDSANKTE